MQKNQILIEIGAFIIVGFLLLMNGFRPLSGETNITNIVFLIVCFTLPKMKKIGGASFDLKNQKFEIDGEDKNGGGKI